MPVQILSSGPRPARRAGLLILTAAAAAGLALAEGETVVARIFQHAGRLLQEGRPELALDEYRRLVDGYPNSDLADDALVAIGAQSYPVDDLEELGKAQGPRLEEAFKIFDRVRREHPQGNSAPAATLRMAMLRLEPRSAGYNVEQARALFSSVSEIYPESGQVAQARLGMAYCSRLEASPARVIADLQPFWEELAASPLAPRARLWRADAFEAMGWRARALELYQQTREDFARSPEAGWAQGRAALLLRRTLAAAGTARLAADPTFEGQRLADLKQAPGVSASAQGWIYLADAERGRVLRLDARGRVLDEKPAAAPSLVAVDPYGQAAIVEGAALRMGKQRWDLAVPDGKRSLALRPAAPPLARHDGMWWLLDERGRSVLEFDRALSFKRVVWSDVSLSATRARLGPEDTAWLLDRDSRRLVRVSAAGEARAIPLADAPAALRRPVDLAVDAHGAAWVLDAQRGGAAVFSPAGQYEGFVPIDAGDGSSLAALEIDAGGGALVYDARQRRLRRFIDALAPARAAAAPGAAPGAGRAGAEVKP
jgi:hypothetical protein